MFLIHELQMLREQHQENRTNRRLLPSYFSLLSETGYTFWPPAYKEIQHNQEDNKYHCKVVYTCKDYYKNIIIPYYVILPFDCFFKPVFTLLLFNYCIVFR